MASSTIDLASGFQLPVNHIELFLFERAEEFADRKACEKRHKEWKMHKMMKALMSDTCGVASAPTTFPASMSLLQSPASKPNTVKRYRPCILPTLSASEVPKLNRRQSERATTFLDLPGEIRNQIYHLVDLQQSLGRTYKLDYLEPLTPAIAQVSRQVRAEYLSIYFEGRSFVANMEHIGERAISRWLRVLTSIPAARWWMTSFTVLWTADEVYEYFSCLPGHRQWCPANEWQSFHENWQLEVDLGNLCRVIVGAGLGGGVVTLKVHRKAKVPVGDRLNFESRLWKAFMHVESGRNRPVPPRF